MGKSIYDVRDEISYYDTIVGYKHDPSQIRIWVEVSAQCALDCRDACNSSGIELTMHTCCEVLRLCRHVNGYGTDWFNQHPILRLFLHKLSELAGVFPADADSFWQARSMCKQIANGNHGAYPMFTLSSNAEDARIYMENARDNVRYASSVNGPSSNYQEYWCMIYQNCFSELLIEIGLTQ